MRTFAELLQIREHAEQYDKRVYDRLLSHEVAGIVQDFTTDQKAEEATNLVLQGVGVLLVRPEILHAKNEVLSFLADQQVNVLKTVDLKLDPKQYVGLYSHAFLDEQKEAHVRRRALGYIDSDLCAVVIRHQDQRLHSSDFMQFMVDTYKGVAGKPDNQTLRGKIVHGLLADVRSDPAALRALDPLGIYSQLSQHNIYPDSVDPFLANLPGVHMPDSSEVIKDFCVLAGDKGVRERFL